MPRIEDIRPYIFIELGFKREKGNGQIRIFCNRLPPALMPGPNGRQNVINDRNSGSFGGLYKAHIKARIVDANKDVGLFLLHRID